MRPESSDSAARTELREMVVRLVHSSEQPRYQELMREHHYLGHLPKIGETLWYVASWREQWGRAVELFGLGTEVRGTRSLDRLELPPAICPLEAGGQQ